MDYHEYAAGFPLDEAVECLWTLEGRADGLQAGDQPVLPDGKTELIVHLGDAFERIGSLGSVRQPSILFAGQLTEPLLLRPTGRIAVLGIRFKSDGASAILDVPQHELAGLTIDAAAVSAPLHRTLDAARNAAASLRELVDVVRRTFAGHVRPDRVDQRLRFIVSTIHARRGLVSIDGLAAHAGVSRRHLERRFNDVVGLTPKRLARIARFQHALRVLERTGSPNPGTTAALASGYTDHAHFVRDFRELAGRPPGAHLLRRAELTGFFVRGRPPT